MTDTEYAILGTGLAMTSTSAHWTVRLARWVELCCVFFVGPVIGMYAFHPRHVMLVLAGLTVAALVLLLLDPTFERKQFWNWRGLKGSLTSILIRFVILMTALGFLIWMVMPELLFNFPRERPRVWAVVMVLYPVLSVYPQEIVWRTFFHHRYRTILTNQWVLIGLSALAFGMMHIVFRNSIAVAMTIAGGALFAHTYEKTRSAAAAWLEHSLYGCAVFTIGLGVYFYGGAVQ